MGLLHRSDEPEPERPAAEPPRPPYNMNGEHEALWRFNEFLHSELTAMRSDFREELTSLRETANQRFLWSLGIMLTISLAIFGAIVASNFG